jgi:hypothetical protein
MLVYESPPELGAVWTEFVAERQKLTTEQAKHNAILKKKNKLTKEEELNGWRNGILELQFVLRSWWSSSHLQY